MAKAKPGNERLRLTVLLLVFGVAVVVVGIRFWGSGGIAGSAAQSETLEYTARNLPLLEVEDLDQAGMETADSGGNPFTFRAPPTPTPNLTPPPTPANRPTLPPRPTPTPRRARGEDGVWKKPPPPFDREYIGYLGPAPMPVAAFRKAGKESVEIEIATVGDVLDEIYIVRAIGLESVKIGFVGYDASEDTSVPLSEK